MSGEPIDLDGRRTLAEKRETELRRQPANGAAFTSRPRQPHIESLEDQMLREPARTWIEVMEKWRFLLDRYAATADAEDERVHKLIARALGDFARLKKHEGRKP